MKELRIAWEPETAVNPLLVSNQVLKYMDNEATFAQFPNDVCLMLKPVENIETVISGCMVEARRIADFKVYQMSDGDFLVFFASALIVYVGNEEFASRKEEISQRKGELMFSSESFISPAESPRKQIELLVGLYARGKLQRDAWAESSYQIVRPNKSLKDAP